MKKKTDLLRLRALCENQELLPQEVLSWIAENNLWNLWVPKSHGGLEMPLAQGLETLRLLAETDGSLGWTVTLCSGANFFVGNLQKEVAHKVFVESESPVCLGGSGGVFGTAEKKGDAYIVSGKWKYATGAPYLSHFTLNAKIIENGKVLKNKDGSDRVCSFLLNKNDVNIVPDWKTMGLKATATHSFEVHQKKVDKAFTFLYNKVYHESPIFKIDFSVFADLTLWVNYIGMATSFCKEARKILFDNGEIKGLKNAIDLGNVKINQHTLAIEEKINSKSAIPEAWVNQVHQDASKSVKTLSEAIIRVYPLLGIRACSENHRLNYIFKDYFTATQHHIFSRK